MCLKHIIKIEQLQQRVKDLEDQLHKSSADWLERCKKFRKQDADEYEAELSTIRADNERLRDALKLITKFELSAYPHEDFYLCQETAEQALGGGA